MSCLIQIYDDINNTLLKGGTTIYYRVNWLLIDSWNFTKPTTESAANSDLVFGTSGRNPAIPALLSYYTGASKVKLAKAVIECFQDSIDRAHLINRMIFTNPKINLMKSADLAGGLVSWTIVMGYTSVSVAYRPTDFEEGDENEQ